ncbi:SPT46 protein, partial [Upupa epops]|nr:SPT46 protein [Upupa epops]
SCRASIRVLDILPGSLWQMVLQCGYMCVSHCLLFPALLSMKTHIWNSTQEGYSCKVYYRRLKALWEKE